jgi:sulfopyruvate decarboxylase subunit alpha
MSQVISYRSDHAYRHLRTGRVVKEDRASGLEQSGKLSAYGGYGKRHGCYSPTLYVPVLQSASVPVSVENSRIIYNGLKRSGVKIVSALPETWLVHLINMADADPDTTLVRLTREEEAIGISAGAHLAGVRSALLMQNHGFLAAINPIVSLAFLYKIPLLMLISYRGHMGERDPWQTQGGRFTEPVLKALDIPYVQLTNPEDAERRISDAQTLAESSLTPVALLLSRQLMWEG